MITVTFARAAALNSFASMAEGMWENRRDDQDNDDASMVEFKLWDEFTDAVNAAADNAKPDAAGKVSIDLANNAWLQLVRDVRDNCADNAHDMGIDDTGDLEENPDDAAMACGAWEVQISVDGARYAEGSDFSGENALAVALATTREGKPNYQMASELGTRQGLEVALEALVRQACEQDTASPEGHTTRCAIEMVKAMLQQRGLEVFKNGDDGTLPDFCNVVIFG